MPKYSVGFIHYLTKWVDVEAADAEAAIEAAVPDCKPGLCWHCDQEQELEEEAIQVQVLDENGEEVFKEEW